MKPFSWEAALASPQYKEFGAQKSRWNRACRACDCLALCSGDCLKHRLYGNGKADQISWLCSGWQQFIRHSRERLQKLAKLVLDSAP
jgi:uncharacterized protein